MKLLSVIRLACFKNIKAAGQIKITGSALLLGIALFLHNTTSAQSIAQVAGSVHNAKNETIPGASVYLLNTNFATATDQSGGFSFKNVSYGKYSIQVSAVGYATTINAISITGPNDKINITLAQSGSQLDEVVVSAQKSDENAQLLPLSVSAISSTKVTDYKVWNTKDITALVPNLYSANPGDNRNVTSIRGIATTSYDPAVATYIDGVNQFGLDTYIAQLFDVERIEVLRGPQGTLYGRNAMGGVINIITKQPTNEFHGFGQIENGNLSLQRYSYGVRGPLIKDKLFLGVSGQLSEFGGFYTNKFNNSKFDKQNSFMGNYYLKFLATDRLSITANVKHVENRNNGSFALAGNPTVALLEPYFVNQNAGTTLVDNIFNSSLSIKYSGNKINFSSQSAYQTNYRYYDSPIDGDFSPLDAVTIVNNYGKDYNKVKVFTQEFKFSSPASSTSALKWVGGLYGFYNDNPVKQGTHFGKDGPLLGAPFPYFTSIATNKTKSLGIAAFGQGTYSITPKLDVIVGLRYDYEHVKQNILGEFQIDGQASMVTQPDTSGKANFKAFSPKFGLSYLITDNYNVYATYSRGFRTGGLSDLGSDPSQPALYPYNPESSNNFEVGSKNTLADGRVRLNFAVFYTRVNNAQVPTLVLPSAITIVQNAGKLESKGAELELALSLVKGLEVDYNLGYTDAKYKTLLLASNGATVNLNGNRQVFTPKVTSMLGLTYGHNVGEVNLSIHGDWRYLGDQYFDLANQIKQNPYHLFNGRVGATYKNVDLFFWGANLFNKRYIDYAYDFGASHLGNPRTYGVSLRGSF